jgi:hypothetical protein
MTSSKSAAVFRGSSADSEASYLSLHVPQQLFAHLPLCAGLLQILLLLALKSLGLQQELLTTELPQWQHLRPPQPWAHQQLPPRLLLAAQDLRALPCQQHPCPLRL